MYKISCKFCSNKTNVKNGIVRGKQRYKCIVCKRAFIEGDKRVQGSYSNKVKNLVIRMYINNCGVRRIAEILEIPLTTTFSWIKKAGQIVDRMVKNRQENKEDIEILEMDELYTYIKKKKIKYESGLLLIGTDLKILRLK